MKQRSSRKPAASAGQTSRSLSIGIRILETLATMPDPVGLSTIAGMVGLGKASTLRLLRTLQQSGYIHRDHHDNYSIQGDWPHRDQKHRLTVLDEVAEPILTELNAHTGETVALAFLFGDLIRVASVIESTLPIHMSNYRGRVLQPYASSLGKCIAAFQPPSTTHRLLHTYGIFPLTPNTLTDFRAIQEDLASVRERGYAWDRGETVVGGTCIGAPIKLANGEVFSAVSMSMPDVRFTSELEQVLPDEITAAATGIASALERRLELRPDSSEDEALSVPRGRVQAVQH